MTCFGCPGIEGIFNINKPAGRTSFSLVRLIRRLTGEKRVGHAGTLDPLATGVLPVCVGQATRLVEYMVDTTKTYLAAIELGITTDTYDAEGEITGQGDASAVTVEQVKNALDMFYGDITQVPPAYSAVKYNGKSGYKLARAGIKVTPRKRSARIYRINMVDWQSPVITVEIDCGKGTYIRSLAHDLGQVLGCGAYLKDLSRLRSGIFDIKDSVTIDELEEAFRIGYWEQFMYPMDSVLTGISAVILSAENERSISKGNAVVLADCSPGNLCRAYNQSGKFLAILNYDNRRELWQPQKVFNVLDTIDSV